MIGFRKISLIMMLLMILLNSLTACDEGTEKLEAPPELRVIYGDRVLIPSIGLNEWDGAKYDRQDTLIAFMEVNEMDDLVYIKNGQEVGFEFDPTMPDVMSLLEFIVNDEGREIYTYREVKEVPFHWVNEDPFITITENSASMFSSDSTTYEEGGLLRGYKLTCIFGENTCEYGFVIRSDADVIFD